MKKIYTNVSYLLILLLVTVFSSCGQQEDMVMPQATCDTMARVHNDPDSGIHLILEDGRILSPANAKAIISDKGEANLEISGFPVKEGQQIIMGYVPADRTKSSKKIDVNCIVGVAEKGAF